jgi:3-oxoacyl-[acyl-carrier protein] reductase
MSEDGTFDGRTAIVTGGGGGIGTEISVRLAREGANVVVAQRSRAPSEAVVERIEEMGGDAAFVQTDLADDDAIVALVEATVEEFGGVEILVNTATHTAKEYASEMSRELWDEILAVTLTAPFRLAQECYPHMQEAGYGRVVNVGAIQAHSPIAGSVAYATAKAGMEGLVRALAVEWGDDRDSDITANVVHSGPVRSSRPHDPERRGEKPHEAWTSGEKNLEEANAWVPSSDESDATTLIGRYGRPVDVAAPAVFLASPEAGFMTGQVLYADGGRLVSRKPANQSHMG